MRERQLHWSGSCGNRLLSAAPEGLLPWPAAAVRERRLSPARRGVDGGRSVHGREAAARRAPESLAVPDRRTADGDGHGRSPDRRTATRSAAGMWIFPYITRSNTDTQQS